jgi:hypothetical protein
MMELFGMNPRSVQVFEKGIALTCVVRYDDFDVVLSFADLKFTVYYAASASKINLKQQTFL